MTEALEQYRAATALEKDTRNKTGSDIGVFQAWQNMARLESQLGNVKAAQSAHAENVRVGDLILKERAINEELVQITALGRELQQLDLLVAEGDYATIHARAADIAERLGKIKETNEGNVGFRQNIARQSRAMLIESSIRLGRNEEAVTAARDAVARPLTSRLDQHIAQDVQTRAKVRLGQALLGTGQRNEALAAFNEALSFYRSEQAKGANGATFQLDFARVLYHLSRAQANDEAGRAQRRVLLAEAAGVLDSMTFETRKLVASQELIKWVLAAQTAE